MRNPFRRDIDSILSSFGRVASELETHLEATVAKHLNLKSLHNDIEVKIENTAAEIDRADRVLAKVKDLIV
jgi:hypothetical protein